MRWLLGVCVLGCLAASAWAAGSKDKDDEKKKEEELRQEVRKLVAGTIGKEGEGILSLQGKFSLAREQATDSKPFPKMVGYISATEGVLPVIAPAADILAILAGFDRKDVTVSGKLLDKGDQGKFFVASEVVLPPAAPVARKKRGGLP